MDYSELVKRLREHNGWALNETLDAAADAIEELQAAVEREKTYTQFWEDAAKTCKVQYEKMEKKMLDWQAVADEHWAAYQHWFHNYMNDVRPVVRGKWIDMGDFISCSSCNATHLKEFESDYGKAMRLDARTNFCPNCGAKMDKEDTNGSQTD